MVELKPKKSKTKENTIVRRSINRKQLFLLVLVSILIHALGLFLFVRYKPVEPIAEDRADLEPIDFTVIPEEIEAAEEAEVNNTPIEPEPTPPPVEPDPVPAPTPTPEAVTPPAPLAPTPSRTRTNTTTNFRSSYSACTDTTSRTNSRSSTDNRTRTNRS